MKKLFDRFLLKINEKIENYFEKQFVEEATNDYSVIIMNTKENFHVIISQGDISESIPEDGSFLGAYVVSGLSQETAKEMMQRYKDRDPNYLESK